jgi:putative photosynthetic complex assembly protein
MNKPPRHNYFPRGPLLGMFGLVGFALVAALFGRLTGGEVLHGPSSPVAERDLRFEDRADGAVVVYNARDDQEIKVETGQNGFLRGTLRGLARARHAEGVGPNAPFRLTAWADGRLTLDDPSTGRHVELVAFGPDNEAVFARLLSVKEGSL